jgi:uncharacterized membrane protein YcaP (DUF421 family)
VIDWESMFVPATPPLEIVIRGTVMYLVLYTLLRVVVKRETGTTSVADLLVIVLIADAAQNGMAGDYTSITEGALLVFVIIGWSFALDAIAYRWPKAARLIRPRPLLLVRDGQILHRNMRRELISEDELLGRLREHGIDDLSKVREVRIESDGRLSILTRESDRR